MPERSHHHVLNRAVLSVRKLHLHPSPWRRWLVGRPFARWRVRLRWRRSWGLGFRFDRLAIPLRITEVVMCLHEVIDREVILPVVEPRSAPDDLLELEHRVHRPHQYDVADVECVY